MVNRLAPFPVALLIVISLFLLMQHMMRAPLIEGPEGLEVIDSVEMVEVEKEKETPEEQQARLESPPPAPPAPPAGLTTDVPTIAIPAMAAAPVDNSPISLPVTLGASGMNLGSSGVFGGFAGRGHGQGGSGDGSGGGGYGKGAGFKGRPLIPLSTARPQMPEWACKQGIRGWVEVVFTVMPTGRVQDVKLVDADPRGVFEAAAIESISNWIYERGDKAREVKQRVPMDPEDCVYNWR